MKRDDTSWRLSRSSEQSLVDWVSDCIFSAIHEAEQEVLDRECDPPTTRDLISLSRRIVDECRTTALREAMSDIRHNQMLAEAKASAALAGGKKLSDPLDNNPDAA